MDNSKQHFCIFGRQPLLEALKAGKRFDKILLQKHASGEELEEIQRLAKLSDAAVQLVPKEKLESVVKKYSKYKQANHQGVVGFVSMIPYYSLDDILHQVYSRGDTPLLIVLDGITDVGNFGAIARSAECLGAHALVIPVQGSAQINAEAMKASAGALNRILVCREKSLFSAVKFLKASGLRIFGTEMKASVAIDKADFSVPCAIVLGSEGEGISKDILKLCDEKIKIPMTGNTGSLNVSVSAGIVLYEVRKKRTAGSL